jgi:uncharacterized protein YjbI with pentapeptide repeats
MNRLERYCRFFKPFTFLFTTATAFIQGAMTRIFKAPRFASILRLEAVLLIVLLTIGIFSAAVAIVYYPFSTTFDVAAQTEYLEFIAKEKPKSRWMLNKVEVFHSNSESPEIFSGEFEPAARISVQIKRIASGPLLIHVRAIGQAQSPGAFFVDGEPFREAVQYTDIRIPDPEGQAKTGRSIIIPVTGEITVGQSVGIEAPGGTGLLRSGKVTMLEHSLFSDNVFIASSVDLSAGDTFKVHEMKSPSMGFIVVDERPCLTAAYRVIGNKAIITRPGGGEYPLSVSFLKMLLYDNLFQGVSTLFGILIVLTTLLTFLLDWTSFKRESVKSGERKDASTQGQEPASGKKITQSLVPCILLFLLFPAIAFSQEVHIKTADHEGQGVIRSRKNECFMITFNSVVGKAWKIDTSGENSQKYEVEKLVHSVNQRGLSVFPLKGIRTCETWPPAENLEARLTGAMEGTLKIREADGALKMIPVNLRKIHPEYLVFKPKDSNDEIRMSMIGSSLMVNGVRAGLLRAICANDAGCDSEIALKKGECLVLRLDVIMRALESFFGSTPKYDLTTATAILDRAFKTRDGSDQGQAAAVESLLMHDFNFKGASFNGISLAGAKMPGADFTSSSFKDGDLSNAKFEESILNKADLSFATLQRASFRGVKAEEAYFQYTYADDGGVKEAGVSFEGATLNRSSFLLSRLSGANFRNANLRGVCLAFCDLTGADFTGADLTDAIFHASVLDNAKFEGAIIDNTDVTSAVALGVTFTTGQRKELRRSQLLANDLDIKIWGHAKETDKWDPSSPDFNSFYTKLRHLPFGLRASLKFRNGKSLQPVGPFKDYHREGPNDIRSYHWFDSTFWNTASRSERLKKRLRDLSGFLHKRISEQGWIEGDSQENNAWISFIEKNSQVVIYASPLVWTSDSATTLLLSKGLITQSEINEYDWQRLAVERCRKDAAGNPGVQNDSWKPMYPPAAVCDLLYPGHFDAYKKWTIARSKNLNISQIEAIYSIRHVDFQVSVDKAVSGGVKDRLLIFEHLDNSQFQNKYSHESPDQMLSSPFRMSNVTILFKLPSARSRYSIAMRPDQAPPLKTAGDINAEFVELRFIFDFQGVTAPEKSVHEMTVTPKKAKIVADGKTIWEGPIQLLGNKK